MDKRRHYILVLDTETANTITLPNGKLDMTNVLVYDCGWAVVDTHGTVYETASYVNRDIFCYERDLMRSAYYAWKIPHYLEELEAGTRKMADLYEIRKAMLETLDRWNIKEVAAHNARFDFNALNTTERYVTQSRFRYFFPFDKVTIWDTMRCAQSVICKMPTYIQFCERNNYLTNTGKPRKTAEVLYRFITGNNDFEESHTGLEDVMIEKEILAYCYRQHKAMEKELFPKKEDAEPPHERTDFERALYRSLKLSPMLRGV